MVKVSEIRGRYSFEGVAYGPFQPSTERPYIEVPETLANALNLPRYGGKSVRTAETPVLTPEPELPEPHEQSPLPDDFPMHKALTGAGFTTVESVKAATDEQLDAIDGIAAKAIERIREALK